MPLNGAAFASSRPPRNRRDALMRMRLVHALAELACERGLGSVSADQVAALAGVGGRDFAARFASLDDCVLAGCAEALARARRSALAAAGGSIERDPLRALDGILEFVALESELAGLCLARLLAAGPYGMLPGRGGAQSRAASRELLPALALAGAALDVLDALPGCSEASLMQAAGLQSTERAARLAAALRALGLLAPAPAPNTLTDAGRELKRLFVSRARPGWTSA